MTPITKFGPQPFTNPEPPVFYECGCCGHYHPINWDGDCRDDNNRFTDDDLDAHYGGGGWAEKEDEEKDEPNIGERCTCSRCSQELEWNGTVWWDRGGGATCGSYWERGELIHEDHTKTHLPNYTA